MWTRYGYTWNPPKVHVSPVPPEMLRDSPDQAEATAFASSVEHHWTATAKAGVAAASAEAASFASAAPADDPMPRKLHGPG
jgi:hypothetical protein